MSWLKSAISRAAGVGAKTNNLTRTARTFADSVIQQAAGGAKIVQDRLSGQNLNSFKNAVRRLDEVALNARKLERVQALACWLATLQDIQHNLNGERSTGGTESPRSSHDEDSASSRRASSVYFLDPDIGSGEPLNFRDAFLHSQALENIVTSMILEAPVEEEVSMLLDIFGLCLAGGQELHNAIISSIQDLSKSYSTYVEEVMLEEILQLGARLRSCLQKKTHLIHLGDTREGRALKVEMLKGLTTTLKSVAADMEKRLLRTEELVKIGSWCVGRQQKQEALDYRVMKAQEVTEIEKALATDIRDLTKRRDELEAELNEVKGSLAAATSRHINIQEEKEQFDEASGHIVAQLSIREDELTRSIAARKVEANAVDTWLSFLEDTWLLQTSCGQEKEMQTQVAYEDSKKQYLQLAAASLLCQEVELNNLLKHLKFCADELEALEHKQENMQELGMEGVSGDIITAKHKIQDKYLETEFQVVSALKSISKLKIDVQAYHQLGKDGEADETIIKLTGIFEMVDKLRAEFEGRQRPLWDTEDNGPKIVGRSLSFVQDTLVHSSTASSQQLQESELPMVSRDTNPSAEHGEDGGAVLAARELITTSPPEEQEGWELDELDEELSREDTARVS